MNCMHGRVSRYSMQFKIIYKKHILLKQFQKNMINRQGMWLTWENLVNKQNVCLWAPQPDHTASKRKYDWLKMPRWKYLLKFGSETTMTPICIFYLYRVGEVFLLIFGLPSQTSDIWVYQIVHLIFFCVANSSVSL